MWSDLISAIYLILLFVVVIILFYSRCVLACVLLRPSSWDFVRLGGPKIAQKKKISNSVSHYSAIGDTISCDAPYSAIGLRGKFFFSAISPLVGLVLDCDRPFFTKRSLRYHREHSATGVLLHLSRDSGGGGHVGRLIKVSKRVFLGVRRKVPQNTPENRKMAQKVPLSDFLGHFLTFWRVSGTFRWIPGGTLFETFLRFWAWKAQRLR